MTTAQCRRFVIVATQRSGSTLLVKSLDCEPSIFCAGEIFHGGPHTHHPECNYPQTILGSRHLASIADRYFQRQRVARHINNFYSQQRAAMKAVGFKVMTSQLRSYHTLLPQLVAMDTVRFFLYRDDSFAAALSNFRAISSGVYHSDRVMNRGSTRILTPTVVEFQKLVKRSNDYKQEALNLYHTYGGVLLSYERLIECWETMIAEIGDALGIPNLRVGKALNRIGETTDSIQISNLEELRAKFGPGTSP